MNWYKKIAQNYNHFDKDKQIGDDLIKTHTISDSSGRIMIMEKSPYAQGRHSIYEFVVDDAQRGRGIGTQLVNELLSHYPDEKLSAQVSSIPSLRIFYNAGFRPSVNLNASYDETINLYKENWNSLQMVKN